MKALRLIGTLLSSRIAPPVVIGIFLLVYIGIAFFTEDALIALMDLVRSSAILAPLLALLPLSSLARMAIETRSFLQRRRAMAGDSADLAAGLFTETVELAALPAFAELQEKLNALGYRTRRMERSLSAWRGCPIFPARLLFLSGAFCLFLGITVSLTTRTSYRGTIVEGEPFPGPSENSGVVERIGYEKGKGRILSRELVMEVAPSGPGEARRAFGIYPPGMAQGSFVYPRYLGVALLVRFSAPDLPSGFQKHAVLDIYPPGKEAAVEIPDSPYRLMVSLASPADGLDPYETGRMAFVFKLLKDREVLFSGDLPGGGTFSRDGYALAFPDFRRMVITDFIRDYGVLLIWASAFLEGAAWICWLPIRLFFPRREMSFVSRDDAKIRACSRAEGSARRHGEVFTEALDQLESARATAEQQQRTCG